MSQYQVEKSDESLRKLFLGGLDREKTLEPQLQEYFGQYGEVVDCVVIKDSTTQNSKGFGFVTMASIDETDNVLLDKDGDEPHVINKKKVEVKRAIPRGRDILPDPIKKLFVAGFRDANLTEDDLKNYFCDKCTVEKVHLVKDKETGRSKGFGFVELSNRHMVDKAAIVENHEINGIKVVAKKATPKGDEVGAGGSRGGGGRGRGRGRGGYNSGGYGGGGYGGGDSYSSFGGDGSDSYGYGSDRYGSGGRGGRGRGSRGGGGGYGGSSGSSWSGNGYEGWGSGGSGYEAGSNYAGSSSSYGPMKGSYGSGGSYGGGGGYGSGYGSGSGSGSYGGGRGGGRPY